MRLPWTRRGIPDSSQLILAPSRVSERIKPDLRETGRERVRVRWRLGNDGEEGVTTLGFEKGSLVCRGAKPFGRARLRPMPGTAPCQIYHVTPPAKLGTGRITLIFDISAFDLRETGTRTSSTIKCFIAWHNHPRRKFIMGARLSSTAKCRSQCCILN